MLKIIAIVVVVLVAGLLLVAAMQPDDFRVQRSATIKAPPEKIFALINHLPSWRQWSPYEKKDPDMQRQFSGPESGVGAAYAWSGDKNVGKGDMKIAAVTEPSKIVIDLNFIEPFQAHNVAEFDLIANGESTEVTWSMRGQQVFIGKVMGLIINMDRMVGGDFELGLANLKAIAEN
ncbi:MAG: SRPBCC family protein [Spongiibacteraceae bacterium]